MPCGQGRGVINRPAEQPHGKVGDLFYLDLFVYLSVVDRVCGIKSRAGIVEDRCFMKILPFVYGTHGLSIGFHDSPLLWMSRLSRAKHM